MLFLLAATSNGGVLVVASSQLGMQESDRTPAHLMFSRSGRLRVVSCANDPEVCLDREKNPWGGTTCCFQKLCRDTLRDSRNCGACGRTCGFGFVCCDGRCVDVQNDPKYCGSCFEECTGEGRCSFGMCDYGG